MKNEWCVVVPSWDTIHQNPAAAPPPLLSSSKTHSSKPHHLLPTVDYQVAELTWKDGHLGMHALASSSGPVPVPERYPCSWDKPLAAGTLESIVNQATTTTNIPLSKSGPGVGPGVGVGAGAGGGTSWFDTQPPLRIPQSLPVNAMSCLAGSCTLVGSCSVTPTLMEEGKQVRVASQATHDWSSRVEQSISAGTILGSENGQDSQDTCEREACDTGGFTIYTSASPGNTTSSAKDGTKNTYTVDDHDSIWHSRNQGRGDKDRVTVLGKRGRCAAVHNQSERKRRDKINQRMSILQKLVPNSSKTDKASMLDQVIEYMKQLQNKVEMMSKINMSTMMLPFALQQQQQQQQQQQLQMSFMLSPPMGMGGAMGSICNMGMDINVHPMTRQPGMPAPPQGFYPNPFIPTTMASWDHNMPQSTSIPTDPRFSAAAASFLASQSQPSMTMDAYSRMAAMYHQLQVPAAATAPASDVKRI